AGVAELVDQPGDDFASTSRPAARPQRRAENDPEVKALDPLRRPVRGELFRADAPHLFRVGLEEDAEEARTELIPHPVFQVPRILYRLNRSEERRVGKQSRG